MTWIKAIGVAVVFSVAIVVGYLVTALIILSVKPAVLYVVVALAAIVVIRKTVFADD